LVHRRYVYLDGHLWWATEAIPVPATALLPLAALPLLGVSDVKVVTDSYASPVVYLLLGGFIVALGLQRWNLHKRIALTMLVRAGRAGDKPTRLIAGFMAATAILSMWVSNTASTLMMLPIALAVAAVVTSSDSRRRNEQLKFHYRPSSGNRVLGKYWWIGHHGWVGAQSLGGRLLKRQFSN